MESKSESIDLNPLMRLKDALEGAQKNTAKMLQKLERFENRLTDLDEKMKPIQTTTKHYTRAKENISLTLVEVLKTCEYFKIPAQVKEVVNLGFTPETQEEFFEALGKLTNAKRYFEAHPEIKSSASMLSNIDGLLAGVVGACVSEFEKLMQSAGRSIAVNEGQYTIAHPLTPEAARDVKALCDMFETNRNTAHFKVYQTVRVAKLKAELKQQETSCAAQWAAAQQDGPYEKGSHPFKEYFTLAYWLLRSELQLWGSTLPSNEESLQVFVTICDTVIGELNRILAPILAVDKSKNVNQVVRRSKLLLVRLDVLETFNDRYEEFRDLCRPDVRHESKASLSLANMRQAVVTACARSIEFLTSPEITEGFGGGDAKKAEGAVDASSACDLHPAAGNVMYCCSEMQEYSASYRKMRELATGYYTSAQSKPPADGTTVVSPASIPGDADDFVAIVLENLLAALEERATKFDDQNKAGRALKRQVSTKAHNLFEAEDKAAEEIILGARRHLFLCNNLFSVLNHVKDMIDKAEETSAGKKRVVSVSKNKQHRLIPYVKKVESRLNAEQSAFCDTILAATGMTDADMAEFAEQYAKDKAGQGRLLKAKFSMFNTGMDALLAQQGEWRVAASGLRERLHQQMVAKLCPVYSRWYGEYSVVKFSKKHMEEYLKYPPNVVERHLTGFFGRS